MGVDAGDLKSVDRLVMYSGEILEVKEAFVEYLDKPIKVYNFEVEDWHTYYVTEYNVFAHNAGCGGNKGSANPKVKDAAAKGRQMHKDYDYGDGVVKEKTLPSGKRMDGYDADNKIIHELKPNNPKAIKKGMKQLDGYIDEANKVYGPGHSGKLHTY